MPADDEAPASEEASGSSGRLAGRIALVTGASRGLGAAIARRFAREGAHLILVARTQGGLEELDDEIASLGGSATLLPLDLREFDQIDRMGAALFERFGRLDVLVGNAATFSELTPVGHLSPKHWDETMGLNVTANYRLIRSLDPLLRLSPAGRAIFVTCRAGREARAYWGAYAISKAALEQLVGIYADEVEKTSIRVSLVDPGPLRTALRGAAYPGEDRSLLPEPASATDLFLELADGDAGSLKHPDRLLHLPAEA